MAGEAWCSTTELQANVGTADCRGGPIARSAEPPMRRLEAPPERLELPTPWFVARCSDPSELQRRGDGRARWSLYPRSFIPPSRTRGSIGKRTPSYLPAMPTLSCPCAERVMQIAPAQASDARRVERRARVGGEAADDQRIGISAGQLTS